MAIRVALNHKTSYLYDRPVSLGPQLVRLRPAPHCRTPIRSYSLKVEPGGHFVHWQQDPHGNYLARYVFPEKTSRFEVEVDLVAEMIVINPFDFFIEEAAEKYPFAYDDWLTKELRPFLETSKPGPVFKKYLSELDRGKQTTIDMLVALNQRIQDRVAYLIRMEPGVQTPEETLAIGSGSCRDSAWLLVQTLRHMGIAARFVSGYLIQLVADVKSLDGPSGPTADFTDLHAWTEVYLPGAGWIGFDPTSGLLAGEGHIPVACTPDPVSAAPISGGVDPAEVEFSHSMTVTRIHEDPRVTKPYTPEAWDAINALGHVVDARLEKGDVRLTMGGEPTFVSIDDMEGAEWNTAAVGEHKRELSEELIKRLRDRFAPGGLLHYGEGKWYPGESLPRWALACYWRKDGQPMWKNPELIADIDGDYPFGHEDAKRFAEHLAGLLRVSPTWIVPAYEDVYHYLLEEQKLPVNVDPLDPKLKNPEDRTRLTRVFEKGFDQPVGFVLPLRTKSKHGPTVWESGPWPLRREHMFLLPGDSPVGLRLPLDSLPWVPEEERTPFAPEDPMAPRGSLPDHGGQVFVDALPAPREMEGLSTRPVSSDSAADLTEGESASKRSFHTALTVEQREGRLHVFMPPLERLDDYIELVAAIENTASALDTPVVVEGYLPPRDHRINEIKVTPDPGVIEVNIQPAASWDETVTNTTAFYEEARQTRLGTEKFDLDGRHSGTGGGNHIVLGGRKPEDSPFLRRPDMLKSVIGYWVNHPSLSYMFSSRFIGPTSQAPRVDEGRRDTLYELELAFSEVPPRGQDCPPWVVDRVFRNLLVDLTGNTHRAEICIDKLYSPDSSSGRLGLVEFRGFEMPPHAQMSCTQQLLLRALIAQFWETPYDKPIIDWGTALHDRFLLPHFAWRDLTDIVGELRRSGFAFEEQWFIPHYEFRFPVIGTVSEQDITVELRSAIEPWYVLGEEPAGGGTSRFVDSSVERLQVKVTGLVDARHIVTCNGRRVPLHPTGVPGEFVAGVRYRAWQPVSCLHPTIPVHHPLVFDLYDTWSERSIRGCTYHVSHPGGRNYETFPVNANEAEGRRISRFFEMGHTPGPRPEPPRERNPVYPLTLDLRRVVTPA